MYILIKSKRKYDYFIIAFQFDEEIVDIVQKIPTSEYIPKMRYWEVRVSRETAPHILSLIQRVDCECSDDVMDRIRGIMRSKNDLLSLSRALDSYIELPEFPGDLEPYKFQKAGVEYMTTAKRCFNGDDMGTGKTIQTLVSMEVGNVYPHIVICPAVSLDKWRKEAAKWLPHRSTAILDNDNFSYGHDIMFVNYEAILKFLVREIRDPDGSTFKIRNHIKQIGLKGLTCDESHRLKNAKNKSTRAVKKLAQGLEYIWLLSGTIADNRPKEFIPQLQIMRRLNDFGGYTNFIRRYCNSEFEWNGNVNINGSSNLVELNKKLRQTCMIRRKKSEVLKDLPPKRRHNIYVEIDNREEYEIASSDIFRWQEENRQRKQTNLDLFGNIEEKIEHRRMSEDAIELQIINALRVITARGKLSSAKKWIRRFLKTGKKLVVFAHHKDIQYGIINEFPGSAKIVGGMSKAERKRNERIFRESSHCNLIVCSIKSANVTLDLFESHNTLTIEQAWTASAHDQAEDRVWRMGQKHTCNNYYLLGRNTIDEDMYDLIGSKRAMAEASLDGDRSVEEESIYNELVERLKKKGDIKIPQLNESQ